jgi:hypothetical protein
MSSVYRFIPTPSCSSFSGQVGVWQLSLGNAHVSREAAAMHFSVLSASLICRGVF